MFTPEEIWGTADPYAEHEHKLMINTEVEEDENDDASVTYLNDVNVFPRSPDRVPGLNKEVDTAEQDYLAEG